MLDENILGMIKNGNIEEAYERKQIREYAEKLTKSSEECDAEGEEKQAFYKTGYVFLKFKPKANNAASDYDFMLRKKVNKELISKGVSTPKIVLADFIKGDIAIEVQERALGNVLYYRNKLNAAKYIIKHKYKNCINGAVANNFTEINENMLGNFVADYAIANQKKLKHAKDIHFVKLLSDYKIISNSGYYIDYHGENFIYNKDNGFSFIDLNCEKSPSRMFQEDCGLLMELIQIIRGFSTFSEIMPKDKIETINKNIITLSKRVIKAAQSCNYDITKEQYNEIIRSNFKEEDLVHFDKLK